MDLSTTRRPRWLTFDCYGTLIRWDEGVQRVATEVAAKRRAALDAATFVKIFDRHEGHLESTAPFKTFREVASHAFPAALNELGIDASSVDGEALVSAIPMFDPFPETVRTLKSLKGAGFKIALISNTDDDLVAGNVAQLGGHVDEVVTANQARAYKPSRLIFEFALRKLGVGYADLVHICASPALDHAAARDQQFRCIWIDRGTYRKPLADYSTDATLPTLDGVVNLFSRFGWMDPEKAAG